jgi:hypothetical protein
MGQTDKTPPPIAIAIAAFVLVAKRWERPDIAAQRSFDD